MKKYLFVLLIILLISTSGVTASEMRKGISVGAAIGAPFTFVIVGDYNFGSASVGGSLGFSQLLPNAGFFDIGLEGAFNLPFTLSDESQAIVIYPSVGGRLDLEFGLATVVSIGGVITLNYLLDTYPIRIFAKAIPNFQIATGLFRLGMRGEIGALWTF